MSSVLLLRPYASTNTPNSTSKYQNKCWRTSSKLPEIQKRKEKKRGKNDKIYFQFLTMEAEQVFIVLWSCGDLDDGDGKAVGGRGEDS